MSKPPNPKAQNHSLAQRCPHCSSVARVRTRKHITFTVDDLYFQCSNLWCGCSWKSQLSVLHIISPSATPREGLDIPVSPHVPRPVPANDPGVLIPPAANDEAVSDTA